MADPHLLPLAVLVWGLLAAAIAACAWLYRRAPGPRRDHLASMRHGQAR